MIMPVVEGAEPWLYVLDRVGIPLLLVNGALAFALNIAGVLLIDSAGSVVLTLSGVCKVRIPLEADSKSADNARTSCSSLCPS
jgi:hypothetical protein